VRGPWNKDFLDEIEMFPFGSHNDQVDAASLALGKLAVAKQKLWIY
jgi:phage terminase large subunit-like protein